MTSPTDASRRGGWFARLGVQAKILTVFVLLGAVALGSGVYAVVALNQSKSDLQMVAMIQSTISDVRSHVHQNQLKGRMIIAQIAASADAEDKAAWTQKLADNDAELNADIEAYTKTEAAESETWQHFLTSYAAFLTIRDEQLVPTAQGDDLAAYGEVRDEIAQPAIDAYVADLDAVAEEITAYVAGVADTAGDRTARAVVILVASLLVALAVALTLGVVIARRIRQSVVQVQRSLDAMAEGDFTVGADVRSLDELGRMAQSLNLAQVSVRGTLAGVVETAETVAAAAEELAAASRQVGASQDETSAQAGVVA
ncbi:MCP four helix bundle domain-containing protein, partial [Cellulomonas massiliensis]|uniref:MCP four helix bundle domain-containing protein n=1 Tax=Cellulomonas massiliensis TaxID=1465811 RepID=UPI00038272BF